MSPKEETDAMKKRDELQGKLQEAIRNYASASEVKEIERQLKEQAEKLNAILDKTRKTHIPPAVD